MGPIGGRAIVRIRKSTRDANVVWWSGVVTMVLSWIVVGCDGIIVAISPPAERPMDMELMDLTVIGVVVLTLFLSAVAFIIGVLTSAVFEMAAEVAGAVKGTSRSIVKRYGSRAPREGE